MGGNALVIDDPSISKTHASLTVDVDGNITVADTASTNGTFVNDKRIAYGKAVPVGAGDKLKVGTVEVALELTRREVPVEEENGATEESITSPDGLQFTVRSAPGDAREQSEQKTQRSVDIPADEQESRTKTSVLSGMEEADSTTKTSVITGENEAESPTETSANVALEDTARTQPEEESPSHD